MLRAHKIRLYPNKAQVSYFRQACGVKRKAYNWALDMWNRLYAVGEKPNVFMLKKMFNSIKKEEFPYVKDVTKCATENAIIDLGKAFTNFFAKRAEEPKYKKRGKNDAFRLNNDQFFIQKNKIHIPKLGFVKMAEELRFEGKIMSATISTKADYWFASILVETEFVPKEVKSQDSVGIDLGIKCYAQLSDSLADAFYAPKPLKKNLKKLKRLSREVSRKVLYSNNWRKAKNKLARLHYKIRCIRLDFLHKLTTLLSKKYGIIGIEDLSVKWMKANSRLARTVSDLGFYEFRSQLTYKQPIYGTLVQVISRFYPSTKTCSNCGCVRKSVALSERTYICPECGFSIDRDYNAAINIERAALAKFANTEGSSGI